MSVLLAGALALAALQPPAVFRAEVGVVRVEVLVTRKGETVRGLTAADFELRDQGRPRRLEPVLEEQAAVDAVLALDMSASVRGPKLDALRSAAGAFLDGLRAGESAALLAFWEEVLLLEPFTPDLARLHRALASVRPGGSTALCDAVYAALRLREPGPRRTAIVVFSDGVDNLSWLTDSQVVEAASRSDAIVYAVAVRNPGERAGAFLPEVVRATGGQLFEASSERDLRARFLDVLADIRSRYVLSYAVEAADAPGWHALEVRLRRGKGTVLARPGYWRYAPVP
jgi:Ca-activated chloride channel homolog